MRYKKKYYETVNQLASWSRGMIPALGAGGPGFKSRRGPIFFILKFIFLIFT